MPVSTMSSTMSTSRPSMFSVRSWTMRTAPLRSPSYDEIVMKSMLTGSETWRMRSAMKHVTPLSTPTNSSSLPA